MKKYITYILIALILLVVVFFIFQLNNEATYSNSKNSATRTASTIPAQTEQKQIYVESGGENFCSKGAQKQADGLNKAVLKISQTTPLPPSFYIVVFSHYAKSQNACYYELHNQLPMPNGTVSDINGLYIMRGSSEYEVTSMSGGNKAEIAECNDFRCFHFAPVEKDIGWLEQYNRDNAPPISKEDYQALVAKAKISQ